MKLLMAQQTFISLSRYQHHRICFTFLQLLQLFLELAIFVYEIYQEGVIEKLKDKFIIEVLLE